MKHSVARTRMATFTVLALLAGWPAVASQKQKAKQGVHGKGNEVAVAVEVFRESDRELIRNYFSGNRKGLPPGLAKKEKLPPGLEKQLRRNGRLPPGLEKHVTPFPVELEQRLPPLKPGLRRGVIEGHAVILGEHTSAILDAMVVF